jgi:transcriptional regulator with XRE-family HTH domain
MTFAEAYGREMRAPRLDSEALFQALDDARRDRGLSWAELAARSGVAVSTLQRTRAGSAMEADGVLAMVRLVGKAPEDFATGVSAGAEPVRQGRLNTQALHRALDAQRRERGLSWTEMSREIAPWSPGALRRLANGGRVAADLMLACVWWLGRQVNDFVDPDFEHPGER